MELVAARDGAPEPDVARTDSSGATHGEDGAGHGA